MMSGSASSPLQTVQLTALLRTLALSIHCGITAGAVHAVGTARSGTDMIPEMDGTSFDAFESSRRPRPG
jgi:hypothetical protein